MMLFRFHHHIVFNQYVRGERTPLGETLIADKTFMRLFLRVYAHMFLEGTTSLKGLIAQFTHMWFRASVDEHVSSEGATPSEGLVAYFTHM